MYNKGKQLDNVQCLKIVSTPSSNMENFSVIDNTIQIRTKLINQQLFSYMTSLTAFQYIKQPAANKRMLLLSVIICEGIGRILQFTQVPIALNTSPM